MRKKLFIVESSVMNPKYIALAAQRLRLEPVFLTKMTNQEGDALKSLVQLPYVVCDTENASEISRVVRTLGGKQTAGVLTLLDSRLGIVSQVCKRLKLPGVDPAVETLKDKWKVAQWVPEFSPKGFAFHATTVPKKKMAILLSESDAGVVVKPRFLAGGKGFRRIKTICELSGLVNELAHLPQNLSPLEMVAQASCPGELVSLEGFVSQGKAVFMGFTGRRKIESTESAFLFPYGLKAEAKTRCQDAVHALVKRSSYKNGFFHAEYMVNGNDACLIDANIGRPGGANIVEVLSHAFHLDPVDFYENVIGVQVLHKAALSQWSKPPRSSLGVAYGLAKNGRVLKIEGLEKVKTRHTLAVNFGAKVLAMGDSNWSWVGLLAGQPRKVISDLSRLGLVTPQGTEAPVYKL